MEIETDFLLALEQDLALHEDALEVLNGPEDGRIIPLRTEASLIGRQENAEVQLLLDLAVSRAHARLTRENERYYIEDLSSTHGTRVNGQEIRGKTQLMPGDDIVVGVTLLQLHCVGT